jgi:DNA-binding transcriptional MocR family regulator
VIAGANAREIATSAEAAIREGALAPGDALPTVRALASSLRASPATVNSAYRILRERGLVIAEGRRGTRVAPRPPVRTGQRRTTTEPHPGRGDLSLGFPDPALLPSIAPALASIDLDRSLEISRLDVNDRDLLALATASFESDGVRGEGICVVAGALDGIERVLSAHLRPGDRVLIEDPAYPPLRDLLAALGLIEVGVPVDDDGLVTEALEAALRRGAQAVVSTPRAQNPFGSALQSARAQALTHALSAHPNMLIVEDDHAGAVSGAPYRSLIPEQWPRWAVLRSMSKVLHPDMRLAFLAGDETTVARVEGRQWLGPRWVSHILQATVANLLTDPAGQDTVDRARKTYEARRRSLIDALATHGIAAHGRSGLNVWVPVPEEAPVVRAVLDAGWLVLAGERCRIATPPAIRVTTAMLHEQDAPELAHAIATAGRRPRAY